MELPYLLASDEKGNIFEIPELRMAGMSLDVPVLPDSDDLIPLPYGSNLYMLPGTVPVGYDPDNDEFIAVEDYNGQRVHAVAAFMAPAYLQLVRCAYAKLPGAGRLPLYSYTAAGWFDGGFYAAGMRIDEDRRQDLENVDVPKIEAKAKKILKTAGGNRLKRHLIEHCVLEYCCPAARNFVLGRWEAPLPTSPGCNARCIGCISLQPEETGVVSAQHRLIFKPTVDEVLEVAVPHLEKAPRPVVSFGQGCEGEPLLVGELLEESIREIRKHTDRGIINLNSNASKPQLVERLAKAGLDSIRVSLNSVREDYYNAYYRPVDYSLQDVFESVRVMRSYSRWVSLNYLMFPGFSDQPDEVDALLSLVGETGLNMIQTRNLNIDPEWYMEELRLGGERNGGKPVGISNWVSRVRKEAPWVKLGYFNPPREEMKPEHFR